MHSRASLRIGWRLKLALLAVALVGMVAPSVARSQDVPREIAIRVEQFMFTLKNIEVVEGERVRVLLEAVDVQHGFAIPDLGVRTVARPGADPTVIEFVAEMAGRYRFACVVFCGSGHGGMVGVLTVVPAGGAGEGGGGPDRVDDLGVDVVEPDFNLVTLPTTLRIPRNSFAFRLTHRFSRPLAGGRGFDNLLEDFFGFDSSAFIGLELRYGIAPGAQVAVYRNNNRNIQISGKYNVLWSQSEHGIGLDAYVSVEGTDNFRDEYSPAFGAIISKRLGD